MRPTTRLLPLALLLSSRPAHAQRDPQLVWEGQVDGTSILHIQGRRLQIEDKQGLPVQRQRFRIFDPLPQRRQEVDVEIVEGRGRVFVIQQPRPDNNYTLSIAIEDRQGGSGFYSVRAYWSGSGGGFFDNPSRPAQPRFRGDSSLSWSGRVDGEAVIQCRGRTCEAQSLGGQGVIRDRFQFSQPLPARDVQVSLEDVEGRGEVRLVEQPRDHNNHTVKVHIRDRQGGAGDYSFALSWTRPSRGDDAPIYSQRGLIWAGRVDGRVRVIVQGNTARVDVLTGVPVAGERADFDRQLPSRESPNATVRRLRGRGSVELIEYPTRRNGYRLVFEIDDNRGGGDDYVVEAGW